MKKLITALLLVLLSCKGTTGDENSSDELDTIRVECTATVGTEYLDQEYGFADVASLCFGHDGSILVADSKLGVVRRYSSTGEYMMSYGSLGEGPGELSEPLEIAVTESGLLYVSDIRGLNSFSFDTGEWISLNEEFTRPVLLRMLGNRNSSFTALRSWSYLSNQVPVRTAEYALYSSEMSTSAVFWKDSSVIDHDSGDFIRLCNEMPVVASDAEGNVYVSESTESNVRILKYSPEGALLNTISDEFPPVALSEEEKQRDAEYYSLLTSSLGMDIDYTPREFWNTVISLGVDQDSRIWAGVGGGERPLFRVYDQGGSLLCYASIEGIPPQGMLLNVRISPWGMAAFGYDSSLSYMQVFILEPPVESFEN